jgi:hypothetical protein
VPFVQCHCAACSLNTVGVVVIVVSNPKCNNDEVNALALFTAYCLVTLTPAYS